MNQLNKSCEVFKAGAVGIAEAISDPKVDPDMGTRAVELEFPRYTRYLDVKPLN